MSAHIYCDVHGCEAATAVNATGGWCAVTDQMLQSGVESSGGSVTRHVCPDCLGKFNQIWMGPAPTVQTEDGEEIEVKIVSGVTSAATSDLKHD